MIDLAQADRTLRFTPHPETSQPRFQAGLKALREMSDDAFWAFIRDRTEVAHND